MDVIAPFAFEGKPTGLRCKVATAAGDTARVINEAHNFDQWFSRFDLRVPVGDPHA